MKSTSSIGRSRLENWQPSPGCLDRDVLEGQTRATEKGLIMALTHLTRRGFISGLAGLGGVTLVRGTVPEALPEAKGVLSGEKALSGTERLARAFEVRMRAARLAQDRGVARMRPNGDE